ncbi:MAG: nucleotidyl transferase AbiEii/AbiGii toxin family protein [Candidatus Omnitrophota bacterium]
MTQKEFFRRVTNGKDDFLQAFLDILRRKKVKFCAIGGLAVNAYAEPVVSLDLDVVVVSEDLNSLLPQLKKDFRVETFKNSINLSRRGSGLRIQIQTDRRYQPFIAKASLKEVLGYKIPVAAIEDVLKGKFWAAMEETRRPSKRQKDFADILRLLEVRPTLKRLLPEKLKKRLALGWV